MTPGRLARWLPTRSVPLGLLGAVVLVLCCELHVERHAIDYQGGSHWSYRIAAKMARSEAKRDQILVFGDSLARLGIIPTVIEAETGLKGYNFAQTGGQAPGSYFLLRRALANRAKPRAIVLDCFPKLLADDPSFNDDNYPFVMGLGDAFEYAKITGDLAAFGRLAFRSLVPSARSRSSIRTAVSNALTPPTVPIPREILKSIRNWKLNRGAEVVACRPGGVGDLDTWERGYFPRFAVTATNRIYVAKLLDLARSRDIPVFWLLPPYQGELQARCDRSGFDAAHEAFLRDLQARYANLHVLDARRSGYPTDYFFDLHHLGREGAVVLSSDVGRAVAAALREPPAPTRWEVLPPFRFRLSPVAVEHVDESRAVLRDGTQAEWAEKLLR